MTQELDRRIKELCELITKERERHVFLALVAELNQCLEEKDKPGEGETKLVSNPAVITWLITNSPTFRPHDG